MDALVKGVESTHQPVAATNHARSAHPMLAESEHAQLALLDDHEHVHPRLRLRTLPSALPVLLATQHHLLRPRRPEKGELLVCDTDVRRRVVAANTVLIFPLFPDDRMGKVRREAEGGSEEGCGGTDTLRRIE